MAEGKSIGALLIKIAADTASLKEGIAQSKSEIKSFDKNIGQLKSSLIGAFSSIASAAGIGVTAFTTVKKTIEATQLTSDKFEKAMAQTKSVVDFFFISLSSGDFTGFIQGLKDSIKYSGELADTLDNLEDVRRGLSITKAKSQSELTDLALIYKDKTGKYSKTQRQDAFGKAKEIMTREATDSYNTFVTEANAMLNDLAAKTGLTADKIKDIIENYQGGYEQMFGDIQEKMNSLPFGTNKSIYIDQAMSGDEQAAAKIWLNYQKASAEKLDAVAKALTNQYNAANDVKTINLDLIRTYNELFKIQERLTKKMSSSDIRNSLASMSKSMSTDKYSLGYYPASIDPKPIENVLPGTDVGGEKLKAQWQDNYDSIIETYEKIKAATADMTRIVQDSFTNLAAGFGESIGNMIATGQKMDFSFVVRTFGELATSLGKMMIGMGMAGLALKKLSIHPALAIAAGIALVALGAAASSAANNIVSGGGSGSVSMPSSAQSGGSDYFSRNMYGGYQTLKVEVTGTIKNNVIALSNARGASQMERY